MFKACIFDLDGTLANTLDSMAVVMNEVLREFGLKELPTDNYRYYCGEGATVLVRKCLIDGGDPELTHFEEAEKCYRERFNADPMFKVTHYPGMPEVLKKMKQRGIKLGVCSNKPDPSAKRVIHEMFGDDLFDDVLGQSDTIRRKPAPDAPLAMAEEFGVLPSECLYVGDTKTDMLTGKAAGMYTVGALWGFRTKDELVSNGADALAANAEELFAIFEEKRQND